MMTNTNSLQLSKKPLLVGLLIFLIMTLLTQSLTYQQYIINKEASTKAAVDELNRVKDRLKSTLSHSLSATKTLAFIVKEYDVPADFNLVAKSILESTQFIDALQLTKGGMITHVYPLNGNEAAIGYDILKDSLRNKEAYLAIEKNALFFAGPLELKQGGLAVVGRLPIVKESNFIGFSTVLIKLETLLAAIDLDSLDQKPFLYQLSKVNPSSGQEDFFLPVTFSIASSEAAFVEIADGFWKLYVLPKDTQVLSFGTLLFFVLGMILSITTGFYGYSLAKRPSVLSKLVEEKTKQLLTTKSNYEATLERVSDAFVALDVNWRFTYMNKKAGEIFNRDPRKIIGKHIWTEFPEWVNHSFYKIYPEAMTKQNYHYLEEFYPSLNIWVENHIYPSSDGLSIYFRDITAKRKAHKELEDSERYFRALIENKSDALVLIDRTGHVIYQSPSVERITGYSLDEIQQLDPITLIHPDEIESSTLFFAQLQLVPGESMKRGHRVKRKDGNYIWIEGMYTNLLHEKSIEAIVYNYIDVTLQKTAEQEIHLLLSNTEESFLLLDRDLKIVTFNQQFKSYYKKIWGKDVQKGASIIDYTQADRGSIVKKIYTEVFKGAIIDDEIELPGSNGTSVIYSNRYKPVYDTNGVLVGVFVTSRDITDKKQAEEKIKKGNRLYALTSSINQTILHVKEQNSLFQQVCRIACEVGKFDMAWIGLVDVDGKKVFPVCHVGDKNNYLSSVSITVDEFSDEGGGPTGLAFREGRVMLSNDIENDSRMNPWKKKAMECGYRSSIGIPLKKEGMPIGIFSLYSSEKNFFDAEEVNLLEEMGMEISFALDVLEKTNLHKKSELALQSSEEKYRFLFNNSPMPKWVYDLDSLRILEINQGAMDQYGYTREEFLSMTIKDILEQEAVNSSVNSIENLTMRGPQNLGEWKHRKKNGEIINVSVVSHEIQYNGRRAMIVLSNDITEQVNAHQQLRLNEQRFRSLVQSGVDLIAILNSRGDYLFTSPTINPILGYPDNFLNGRNAFDFIHSEDVTRVLEQFQSVLTEEKINIASFRFKHYSGEWRWLETVATNLLHDPSIKGIVTNSRDVTERYMAEEKLKESHERLVKLTNKVPAVIYQFEMTPQGVMTFPFVSKGIEQIYPGLNSEEMMKNPVTDFTIVHEDDQELFAQSILDSCEHLSEWNIEFRANVRTGESKWIQGSSRPEKKIDGTVVWYGYMQDITNLKNNAEVLHVLNDELKKRAEELMASNQELERFAYVASHDLQEPLRMVTSFLQLFQKKYQSSLDEQADQYIHFAVDGAERMKQLIMDLLLYSRIGTQNHTYEPVDLNKILTDVLHVLQPTIEETMTTIVYETLPEINGVTSQLNQLLQNLIVNAIKYRKPDEPARIIVRWSEDSYYWHFEVEDNGIGIDKRFFDKIFVVFQRLHTRTHYTGTGIGLAICKKIIERHGGSIRVDSELGEGSTFYFSLAKR